MCERGHQPEISGSPVNGVQIRPRFLVERSRQSMQLEQEKVQRLSIQGMTSPTRGKPVPTARVLKQR